MEGVILFADNDVFKVDSFENKLFNKLRTDETMSVIPICTLSDLERTIETISTFKALILDWNFGMDMDDDDKDSGIELPVINPGYILKRTEIYSLIYIYSQEKIPDDARSDLEKKFKSKIKFREKGLHDKIDDEYKRIKNEIEEFEQNNKHMEIPFIWSHAINRSVQQIFGELEHADPNWIKEIRDTTIQDGGEPTSEIIDIFHHLLSESLIQNEGLRNVLNSYQCDNDNKEAENTAKLYRRIFYSRLAKDAPLMTGDIFRFNESEYGILITPECEINRVVGENKIENDKIELVLKKDVCLEFLTFKLENIDNLLSKRFSGYKRGESDYVEKPENKKRPYRDIFNNEELSIHILPSFPFADETFNLSACVDFKKAFHIMDANDFKYKRTNYKLNAPYIHQLRQRFVVFFGKYGVPAIPQSLRDFNLK